MTNLFKKNINNIDNYNISFQDGHFIIFNKYLLSINEYLKHFLDNIYIQNTNYYTYVLKRGILTVNHVFKFLLIYTKNIDIVYYNCQKASIYYIEFMGQISDDNHSFLQLNSKDAALFVYKKTIYEINNGVRNDFIADDITCKLIDMVDILINIYNQILNHLIDNNTTIDVIKIVNTELINIMQKIIRLSMEQSDNKVQAVLIFITYFNKSNLLDFLNIFLKKIKKKNSINLNKLEQLLLEGEINNTTPIKYINRLLNSD